MLWVARFVVQKILLMLQFTPCYNLPRSLLCVEMKIDSVRVFVEEEGAGISAGVNKSEAFESLAALMRSSIDPRN